MAVAHVGDAARLSKLALEKSATEMRHHLVAEEGVAVCDMCEVIGWRLGLPVRSVTRAEADALYGWLAMFVAHALVAAAAWTRETLGWEHAGPGMLEDLAGLQVG